jgi:hypothetical protein
MDWNPIISAASGLVGALAWIIHERSLCQSDGLKWTVAARGGVDE